MCLLMSVTLRLIKGGLILRVDFLHFIQFRVAIMRSCLLFVIGVIPANGEVKIEVVFSPTEFATAVMKLKVCVYKSFRLYLSL